MFVTPSSIKFKTWKVGELIGGEWEVLKVCSGGFGMVYLASNKKLTETAPSMPRVFALKTFSPEIYKGSTTFDDFDREA